MLIASTLTNARTTGIAIWFQQQMEVRNVCTVTGSRVIAISLLIVIWLKSLNIVMNA
jgi:hypothetical protein